MISQNRANPVTILQRIYVEHPVVMDQLLGFFEDPGFGSFTVYAESGNITYGERRETFKDRKGQ